MKIIGVILGSGLGERFGASFPKQFMSLNGKMVIQHSIDAMKASNMFDHIICTMPPHPEFSKYDKQLKNVDQIIIGGHTRTETLLHVLNESPNADYIVFHDSVRPFIKPEHFRYGLETLEREKLDYLLTAQKITDALIKIEEYNSIFGQDRSKFYLCQTPEFFRYSSLVERKDDLIKNLSNYIYIGQPFDQETTKRYEGDVIEYNDNNLKITYERDLFNAEQLMKYNEVDESNSLVEIFGKKVLLFGSTGDIGKKVYKLLSDLGALIYTPTRENFDLNNPKTLPHFDMTFDCVVYCAGTYATDEEDLEQAYNKIMPVNFESVVSIIKHSEQTWLKNGGNIVILGSACATYGRKGISLYSASKSAINAFVEGYNSHLEDKGIKINVIAPAKVKGKLQETINPKADQSQMIAPERLAEIIAHYVTTKKTGQIVYVRYGLEDKK